MAIYSQATNLIIGQANVTFGNNPVPLIADNVVFNAEPQIQDLTIPYEFGQGPVDKIVVGWTVTVTMALAEESLEAIKLAIPVTEKVDGVDAEKKNLTDSRIGTSLRSSGAALVLHPRKLADADKSQDIKVFKAVSTGSFERVYGLEQGRIAVTFTGLVKDDADSTKSGNYFQYGPDIV